MKKPQLVREEIREPVEDDWEGQTDYFAEKSEQYENERKNFRELLRYCKQIAVALSVCALIYLMSFFIPGKIFFGIILPIAVAIFIAAGVPQLMLIRERKSNKNRQAT